MNDIKCPHCSKIFKVDEAGFANIVKQIRDHQFEEELQNRLNLAEKDKESAVKLAEANIRNSLQEQLSKKDKELTELKALKEVELSEKLSLKESELSELKAKIEKAEIEKKLAVSDAIGKIEKERNDLVYEVKNKEVEKQLLEKTLNEKYTTDLLNKEAIIKYKDEEIARVRDMKLKLSTKMLGESLEQHCETEFNKLRATAFQNAYFEKDNDARNGSKGDFIYRETDKEGTEIISII